MSDSGRAQHEGIDRPRRRHLQVSVPQDVYEALAREAAAAERIPEQHAAWLIRQALACTRDSVPV